MLCFIWGVRCTPWVGCRVSSIYLRLGQLYARSADVADSQQSKQLARLALLQYQKSVEGYQACGCETTVRATSTSFWAFFRAFISLTLHAPCAML